MILGRVALLPVLPPSEPSVDDEFSHLLAGDTFAHGRIANPTPPHPEFFESPHILMHPVYASKFPPGLALFLALGQIAAGNPYWGVVLSGALMVLAFCWAADAWLPPQWTLIAGGLAALLLFPHYWLDSYWGGTVAATGGALVVGGLGRVLQHRKKRAYASFSVGAVLLFLTRTYEGAVLCLAVLFVLAIHFWHVSAAGRRSIVCKLLLPNLAVLLAVAPLVAWYNQRVSGHATKVPYVLYMQQYDLAPPLWVMPPYPPKQFSSANYRAERQWELATYNSAGSSTVTRHLISLLLGAVGVQFLTFGLLLVGVPWARMRGRKKWLVFLAAAGAAALLLEVSNFPHYTAPFTCVLLILIVAAGRALWYRLAALRLRGLVFAVTAAILLAGVVVDYLSVLQAPRTTPRSRLIGQLASQGGPHLVFVDYTPGFSAWELNSEWVYNGADLDASPVVFAHRRSDAENRNLIKDYPNRTTWLVRVGPRPSDVHLEPYWQPINSVAAK
jgi:hypothetical protein